MSAALNQFLSAATQEQIAMFVRHMMNQPYGLNLQSKSTSNNKPSIWDPIVSNVTKTTNATSTVTSTTVWKGTWSLSSHSDKPPASLVQISESAPTATIEVASTSVAPPGLVASPGLATPSAPLVGAVGSPDAEPEETEAAPAVAELLISFVEPAEPKPKPEGSKHKPIMYNGRDILDFVNNLKAAPWQLLAPIAERYPEVPGGMPKNDYIMKECAHCAFYQPLGSS